MSVPSNIDTVGMEVDKLQTCTVRYSDCVQRNNFRGMFWDAEVTGSSRHPLSFVGNISSHATHKLHSSRTLNKGLGNTTTSDLQKL